MIYEDTLELYSAPNGVPADSFMHYGVARRSGRYPWGSGDDPYQRTGNFASRVRELRKQNFTYTDKDGVTYKGDSAIWRSMGMESHQEFRAVYEMAKDDERIAKIDTAKGLIAKGYTRSEIVKQMGLKNESTLRSLLNADAEGRTRQAQATADFLKKQIDEKGMLDVGAGVEKHLNISREKLNEALAILESQDYHVFGGRVKQLTNKDKYTIMRVVGPPDTPFKEKNGQRVTSEIYDFDKINFLNDFTSHDNGQTFDKKWVYPESMNSKRLQIKYAEDGGTDRDGLIEIRPGVQDLSLGASTYAQVRILVDKTHYLKGMAVYNADLPEGVDVRFNSNKHKGTPLKGENSEHSVLKPIKTDDPENPFGSLIKEGITDPHDPKQGDSFKGGQSYYYDKNGKKHLSLINKRAEEGDWGEWADSLSSQFLSKQNIPLIKRQLKKTMDETQAEFDDIMALTNPVVKKNFLQSFADECDHTAVHLEAKSFPRQKYQVILPLASMSQKEIYAPNYEDGEQVALIRYPHGGLFEIPVLTVNNRNREGRKIMGSSPKDAVGINSKVAEILSGADFDGDTVMVIPTNNDVKISHRPPLAGLKGFDPSMAYPERPGMKLMSKGATQNEMGKISNLIADMTIKGAPDEDLEKAVRHSMVVIDAAKHRLDYKRSEQENEIHRLKVEYQGVRDPETGRIKTPAGTLITRAKSQTSIRKRVGSPKIDPKTGELIWKETEEHKIAVKTDKKTGEKTWYETDEYRTQKSNQMSDTKDARTLISKAHKPQEEVYADYANYMKAMANMARREMVNTPSYKRDANAAKVYEKEVKSLTASLLQAEMNAPRERQAQLIANSKVNAMVAENPYMSEKDKKKKGQQELTKARAMVGAKRFNVPVSDKEWEAIQAGAISPSALRSIMNHTDTGHIRELATSKDTKTVSASKIARMQALKDHDKYTNAEIAAKLGVSVSTVTKYVS